MKKILISILGICAIIDCSAQQKQVSKTFAQTVSSNSQFAFEFFSNITDKSKNIVVSPYLISRSLAKIYPGTRENTLLEISNILHFDQNPATLRRHFKSIDKTLSKYSNEDILLKTVSCSWIQTNSPVLEGFKKYITENFKDSIFSFDFTNNFKGFEPTLNKWLNEKMEDLIKPYSLGLKTVESNSILLTDAAFFRGNWASTFGKRIKAPFILDKIGHKTKAIEYLVQTYYYKYAETDSLQIIEIPYKGDSLSLQIIMPKGPDKLSSIINSLNNDKYLFWMSSLTSQSVKIYLPKYSITSELAFSENLIKMGMRLSFGVNGNLSGISPKIRNLKDIMHKTTIQISEDKHVLVTETADNTDVKENTIIFRADHPFLFIIKEKSTQTILFIGQVVNPDQTNM